MGGVFKIVEVVLFFCEIFLFKCFMGKYGKNLGKMIGWVYCVSLKMKGVKMLV